MARYKLRLPPKGDYLRGDDGTYWFIGDSPDEAFRFFRDDGYDEETEWVHPVVLRGRVLCKRDVEAGDAHEDAEPGDTTFDIVVERDSERAMAWEPSHGEVRAWLTGPARPWWMYGPNDYRGSTYYGMVSWQSVGDEFETREAAQEAVEREVAKRVEAWKAAHPQFYRPLPDGEEAD